MRRGHNITILDMTEMPHKTMTYLRMYCNSFPIVLNINHSFSNFEKTSTHFRTPKSLSHILIRFEFILIRFELILYIVFILLLLLSTHFRTPKSLSHILIRFELFLYIVFILLLLLYYYYYFIK